AARFARRRAKTPGEFGEIVRRVEREIGLSPIALVDVVVPIRDAVAERTPLLTEGHAAVHAASALCLGLRLVEAQHELAEIAESRHRVAHLRAAPLPLDEPRRLTHAPPSSAPPA